MITFVVVEFRGGPRDGDRMVVQPPVSKEFRIPLAERRTAIAVMHPPSTNVVFRVGRYVLEDGPYEHDQVAVDQLMLEKSKLPREEILEYVTRYLRPVWYKWKGEE